MMRSSPVLRNEGVNLQRGGGLVDDGPFDIKDLAGESLGYGWQRS